MIGYIGPVRVGLWLSYCQVALLIAGLIFIFMSKPLLSAGSLVIGTIVGRLGLEGFDLCTKS